MMRRCYGAEMAHTMPMEDDYQLTLVGDLYKLEMCDHTSTNGANHRTSQGDFYQPLQSQNRHVFINMLRSLLILAAQSLAVLAAPAPADDGPVAISSRQWGGGGYAFSDWHEGNIQYSCQNGDGGSYTVNWSGTGGFVCGKGWSPGGER
jgi:hypothetical protein